jgi:tRNA-modifying protein YgfZ
MPLTELALLRARGADATRFLQGQLTQDVARLVPQQAALAGYCSAKGRLLATMLLSRDADDELSLLVSADLAAGLAKRLSMFVMRAQCKITDDTAATPLFAVLGDGALQALAADAPAEPWGRQQAGGVGLLRMPGSPFFVLMGTADAIGQRWPAIGRVMAEQPPAPADTWREQLITAGIPWVVAATQEQFVPQMVNLELLGGVNFQKGCYPGQEVVARSQYRGTLKRRMQRFASPVGAAPGQELFHNGDPGQPAGMVVLAGDAAPGVPTQLLAEVKLAALAAGTWHLGAADGPQLSLAALPYAVPSALPELAPDPGAAPATQPAAAA